MEVFVVYHTDMWTTKDSHRTLGVADSIEKAIELAKRSEEAIQDVINSNGKIVMYKHKINEYETEEQVFDSDVDCYRDALL